MKKNIHWKVSGLFCLMAVTWIFVLEAVAPPPAEAIPAWARKYNSDCSLCHYPAAPRLNALGHEFRRAGFRMPDEFNKAQDISQVGNFLSVRGRVLYDYRDRETGSEESEFQWSDTTFFYAGAVAENLSAFAELERADADDVGLVAQIGGIWGRPDRYTTFRTGQFHTLSRVGFGGFDRPTGISTPSIRTDDLTTGGVPFILGEDQRGLELTHVMKRSRLMVQILNGLDTGGDGNEGRDFDTDTKKDYAVVFEQILDELASGFTLYGNWGTWYDGTPAGAGLEYMFARYAATGNWIFQDMLGGNFEVMGGYVRSEDDIPAALGADVSGNAYFVELEHYFKGPAFALLARYDLVDPNDDASDDQTKKYTVGYVKTLQDYLRVAVEGEMADIDAADATDYRGRAELMINF
ncbi:MAG: hypothetical protein HY760_03425 [Nitrospirae bacterium]|nr:hypothetical protein [Nitrospirota bacterium]